MHLVLQNFIREEHLHKDVLEIIKILRPKWNLEDVTSKVFTAGLMNTLTGFYISGKFGIDTLIFKIYGTNTSNMVDRKEEIDAMTILHKHNCGAELYAVFGNGICYEFVPGVTLSRESSQSPQIFPLVAAEMARIHKEIPLQDKKSLIWKKLQDFNKMIDTALLENQSIRKWLSKELSFLEAEVKPGVFKPAIAELQRLVEREMMPVYFCHSDLNLNNIIYNESKGSVKFIDFEYAMPNYPAYDIANHFNEIAGVENLIPSDEFKSCFINEYLKHLGGDTVDQMKFERWVKVCSPVSHLLWFLWAVVQAHSANIEFDFLSYAKTCYEEYVREVQEIRKL